MGGWMNAWMDGWEDEQQMDTLVAMQVYKIPYKNQVNSLVVYVEFFFFIEGKKDIGKMVWIQEELWGKEAL